jgi:MFS family permease
MTGVNRSGGFRTLLKKRNFLYLWLAQLISMTVFNASNYALIVLIAEVSHSATLIGLAIIIFSIPAVLVGAPAGVFVDRMNKRRILWASNCLRAVAAFLFVISLLFNRHNLLPDYLLTLLISIIAQVFAPAEGSSIPLLVDESELMPALSLFNITLMLSQALGFIIFAPVLIALLPTFHLYHFTVDSVIQLYVIIGLLYLVCALLVSLIPAEKLDHRSHQSSARSTQPLEVMGNIWGETLQGWSFARTRPALFLSMLQLSFAGVLLLVISQIATPIVTNLLGFPPNAMSLVFAPAGIGLVGGSILMPRITRRLGPSRTIFIGTVGLAVATTITPLITWLFRVLDPQGWNGNPLLLIIIMLILFAAGLALDFVNIPSQTAMQELSPDWIKGRIISLQLAFYSACSIPIILFIGIIADSFGISRVLYLLSVAIIAFGLWGLYYERKYVLPEQAKKAAQEDDRTDEREPDRIAH